MPPGRQRRSAQDLRGEGADRRRRRPRLAGRALPRARRRRHDRHRRLRHRRPLEPAAPDPAPERRHRQAEGAVSAQRDAQRLQPGRRRSSRTRTPMHSDNAMEIIEQYDIIVNGADNFATRYLVNDACVFLEEAAGRRLDPPLRRPGDRLPAGQGLLPLPLPGAAAARHGADCAEAGVLGALCGTIGSIQATEVLKLILGIGESLQRPPAAVRRALDGVPPGAASAATRTASLCGDNPTITRAHRLRRVLRHARRPGSEEATSLSSRGKSHVGAAARGRRRRPCRAKARPSARCWSDDRTRSTRASRSRSRWRTARCTAS